MENTKTIGTETLLLVPNMESGKPFSINGGNRRLQGMRLDQGGHVVRLTWIPEEGVWDESYSGQLAE